MLVELSVGRGEVRAEDASWTSVSLGEVRVLLLGTTVHEATLRCRVDLPNGFIAEVRSHCVGEFLPRERRRVQVFDDGE